MADMTGTVKGADLMVTQTGPATDYGDQAARVAQ
jgi:hypothetical protein